MFSGFYIPFTYLPDLAIDYGMTPQQSAHLISIIGIFNTVSRVIVGWIADRPWADALILNSLALVMGGVSTMFVPYYNSFSIMAVYSAVFGVAIGRITNKGCINLILSLPLSLPLSLDRIRSDCN